MHYLTEWRFDPFVVVVAVVVAWHEVGLAHLAHRSDPARNARRRRRSLYFYAGLAVLVLSVVSPLDYWGYDYFYVHMVQHILLMFFAPPLVALGEPWLAFVHAVPVSLRRRLGRAIYLGPWSRALHTLGRAVSSGTFAILAFNVVMVVWHLPAPFDFANSNPAVHLWLMDGSFFVAGVFFWVRILPSYPLKRTMSAAAKILALVGTNVVMFVLAMALSIFTNHSWYSVLDHIPGVTLSPFADQQIGAGVLWVCGDFWALPALVWVIRKAIADEGSASALVESVLLHRPSSPLLEDVPRA